MKVKLIDKVVDFVALLFVNCAIFLISKIIVDISFLKCILFSFLNATWMLFILNPLINLLNKKPKTANNTNKAESVQTYLRNPEEKQEGNLIKIKEELTSNQSYVKTIQKAQIEEVQTINEPKTKITIKKPKPVTIKKEKLKKEPPNSKIKTERTAKSSDVNHERRHFKIQEPRIEKKEQQKKELPKAKNEIHKELGENLFVNYESNLHDNTESFAILRFPKNGCIVRTYRNGCTKKRGFKEESFQTAIEKYYSKDFTISGDIRLNTGKETRPFEPDIVILDLKSGINMRIDIEIDEPYAGISRQATHCKGDDFNRDSYFIDRGWIVLRFSELQVHSYEKQCLKFIGNVIQSINSTFSMPKELIFESDLTSEKIWDMVQAQKWEKLNYRENYLNHTFHTIEEESETIERDFNDQEINEETFVESSIICLADNGKNIGFNKANSHPRDKRIIFYPESHLYTIDNTPAPSASKVIAKFFPEFDSEHWSRRKSLELGLSPEDVAFMWKTKGDNAAKEGTYLHEQIENYFLGQEHIATEEFKLFEQFVNDHKKLKPYRTEWRVFDEHFNIAGTIDLIVKNGDEFEIYDWKRSKKIVSPFDGEPICHNQWQRGIGKLQDIDDTSFNRYCLQQSLYRYIIEKNYGLIISKMFLIVLYPDYECYYKVEAPYQRDKVEYILKTI